MAGWVTGRPPLTPRIDAAKRIADAARDLEDARKHLRAVMKALDDSETRSLHVRVGAILLEIDDLRSVLTEQEPA